ncbi:MAG: ATP-binding protein [Verrucomicrobiota bacterium]|jgi:SpoVK/Ycf46/Vps4 family AAA+-type ATPase
MSFIADKKREHESVAEAALAEKDYAKAFFHTAQAADFGFRLAEQSEGLIARRYVEDAYELIEIAGKLKAKAQAQDNKSVDKVLKETAGAADEAAGAAWVLQEKPTAKLADVAGLDEVKETLKEKVLLPFQKPEVFQRFKAKSGAGVLMYGPPGNGKTFIAKAIAGELDAAFFPVNASQIKDKYVGESEKNMQRLFDEARKHERAVIFIDEAEHLLSRRGNRKIGVVTQFLMLADGLVENKNCLLLLAATNKPWSLDEAVVRPGRLGTHIYVGPPDAKAREAIVAYNLREVPAGGDVEFAGIAARTEGYSGADLAEVCDAAKMMAIKRQLNSGSPEQITAADFAAALERVKPSVTETHVNEYLQWQTSREKPSDAAEDED